MNYNDDEYNQGYGLIKQVFKDLTKDNIIEPYISDNDFRSTNDVDNIGYSLYVFDIRHQKSFESAQSIRVDFNFDGVIPAGIYGYALVSTKKTDFYKQRRATNA